MIKKAFASREVCSVVIRWTKAKRSVNIIKKRNFVFSTEVETNYKLYFYIWICLAWFTYYTMPKRKSKRKPGGQNRNKGNQVHIDNFYYFSSYTVMFVINSFVSHILISNSTQNIIPNVLPIFKKIYILTKESRLPKFCIKVFHDSVSHIFVVQIKYLYNILLFEEFCSYKRRKRFQCLK